MDDRDTRIIAFNGILCVISDTSLTNSILFTRLRMIWHSEGATVSQRDGSYLCCYQARDAAERAREKEAGKEEAGEKEARKDHQLEIVYSRSRLYTQEHLITHIIQ